MSARNITFNLPDDLLHAAKADAAEHDTTINALVRELLHEKLTADAGSRTAADRLLAIAERGPYFTINPTSRGTA